MQDRILGGLAASLFVVVIGTLWLPLATMIVLAGVIMAVAVAGKWLSVKDGPG